MGKPDPPAPPDPRQTSAAATSTNVGTAVANAWLNNYNQITPNGNLTYDQTGSKTWFDPFTQGTYDVPTFTATQTLSPGQEALKGKTDAAKLNLAGLAESQSGRLQDVLGQPFSLAGAPAAGNAANIHAPNLKTGYVDDFSVDRKRTEDALMERMAPQLAREQSGLESRLANQGIRLGSKAYGSAMDDSSRSRNDAHMAAILAAGQEQSRMAGMSRDQAQFGNQAAQQGFGNQQALFDAANTSRAAYNTEQSVLHNQPINETSALLSGSQVSQPNYINTKSNTIPTTDVAGIINQNYQQQLAGYQMQNQQSNSLVGGLFGLGSSLLMGVSDDDAKTDATPHGEVAPGMNVWSYRYKGEDKSAPMHLGLMASEVEKTVPEAVSRGPDGMRRVDYAKAFTLGGA